MKLRIRKVARISALCFGLTLTGCGLGFQNIKTVDGRSFVVIGGNKVEIKDIGFVEFLEVNQGANLTDMATFYERTGHTGSAAFYRQLAAQKDEPMKGDKSDKP